MDNWQNAIVCIDYIESRDPRVIYNFVWDHIADSADLFGGRALFLLFRT